jgi:hypothetical protein
MTRDHTNGRQLRLRIAHLAARLIAEDGIDDFSLAKRKAARQVGAAETRNLPSNDEIEAELHAYLQLYQADEQALRIAHLRACALDMMRALQRFNPQLSGSVLEGSAGRYSMIDLHLFTDNPKDVEMFILDRGFDYAQKHRNVYRGNEPSTVVAFVVRTDKADFNISVFAYNDRRLRLSNTSHGRALRHAGLESVQAMQRSGQPAAGDA